MSRFYQNKLVNKYSSAWLPGTSPFWRMRTKFGFYLFVWLNERDI